MKENLDLAELQRTMKTLGDKFSEPFKMSGLEAYITPQPVPKLSVIDRYEAWWQRTIPQVIDFVWETLQWPSQYPATFITGVWLLAIIVFAAGVFLQ